MGTILASVIIAQASEIAEDESNVVWTTAQALEWLNDAQKAICTLRPDASTINGPVLLVAGTKQAITGRRVMDLVRNMGSDGLTPGLAIRLIDKKIKDEFEPNWHTETAALIVDEYVYDARDPKRFYVSPPVDTGTDVYVEISQAINPTNVPTTGDPIDLDDVYSTTIIEWICYRFFGRDSENTPDHSRAMSYLRNFYGLLDKKMPIDALIRPKINNET